MKSILRFSGIILIIVLIQSCKKEVDSAIRDIDGNAYSTVTIGTQVWMVENLKTTRYNDGAAISLVTDGAAWVTLSAPGYCWYANDKFSNKAAYGALYNWYAANNAKLCPTGWHVPSDTDFTTLTTYLLGLDVAGGKLKEAGTINWTNPNTGATNETGFTALPGGYRNIDGVFYFIGDYGRWWSSSEFDIQSGWGRGMGYDRSSVSIYGYIKQIGFSVRCLKY